MADHDAFSDLGSRIQQLQRSWDIRARRARFRLKDGVRWVFRKGLGPPLDLQADLNWNLVSTLSAVEAGLHRLAEGKGDRAELDAQIVRLEGLRLECERQWAESRTELLVLQGRLSELERSGAEAIAGLQAEVAALREQLARLEDGTLLRLGRLERRTVAPPAAPSAAAPAPAPEPAHLPLDYFKFEARFRGSRDEIRRRHEPYVALFSAGGPVLDIGFGRGEFLEALRDAGVPHKGIDPEPDMVEHGRALGLDVEQGTALEYLAGLGDASLGGVFLGQVVEHLSPAEVMELLRLCAAKIRAGGLFVAETPNPLCPAALANFFIDPTHVRPVHPELFSFLAEEAGLAEVAFRYTSGPGDLPDPLLTSVAQAPGADRYMDYALIGRVPDGSER